MRKIYLLCFVLILFFQFKAQTTTFSWAKNTGSKPKCLEMNYAGEIFSCEELSPSGMVMTKYNPSGSIVWSFTLAAIIPVEMKTDSIGNSYVLCAPVSSSTLTLDIDPGAGVYNVSLPGRLLIKYDNSGSLVWGFSLPFVSFTPDDQRQHLAIDRSGNAYIAGDFSLAETLDFDPGAGSFIISATGGSYIAKYDKLGNYVYAKNLGSSSCGYTIYGIEVDQNKNVFVLGSSSCSLDFDYGPGTVMLNGFYLVKYDSTTAVKHLANHSCPGNITISFGRGCETAMDKLGNFYMASSAQAVGSVNYNFGLTSVGVCCNGSSAVLAKFAGSTLNDLFSLSLVGTNTSYNVDVRDLTVDNSYNSYVAISSKCTQGKLMRLAKVSSTGSSVFDLDLVTPGNCTWPVLEGVATDGSSIYINSINSNQVLDYDPGAGLANMPTGPTMGVVAKYNSCSSAPIISGSIAGTSSLCQGIGAQTYSLAAVPSATAYTWGLPGGWTGTSTTNIISTIPGISGGNISVTASNACGTSSASVLSITVNPLPSVIISGTNAICNGNSAVLTASGALTYTWNTSATTASISVSPSSNTNYTVTGTSVAGCTNTAIKNIMVNPLPLVSANTTSSIICGPPGQQTATVTASGAVTYTWNPGGAGSSIAISPSVTTTYTVTGTDPNGCTNTAMLTQSVSACTSILQFSTINSQLLVYPNPFSNIVTILSDGEKQSITIYNVFGELVHTEIIEQEKTEINLNQIPSGVYFIKTSSSIQKIIKD